MSAPTLDPTAPLVDPGQAFLDAGPQSPPAVPTHHDTALEISAAVLVMGYLVRRELAKRDAPQVPTVAAASAWDQFAPTWLKFAVPAIRQAYALGSTADLTDDELQAMATDYANSLGDYLRDSSADALNAGMEAQLAQRWSPAVAWHRAGVAYGLDKRDMLSYVKGVMSTSEQHPQLIPTTARLLVDKAFTHRAEKIGETESWTATQSGQAMAWMYLQRQGRLPAGATKRWRTATEEDHCAVCRELAEQNVPLSEPFLLSTGVKIWSPQAHPGCACRLELLVPLSKAYDPRERRDFGGRWATVDDRPPVTSELLMAPAPLVRPPLVTPPLVTAPLVTRPLVTPAPTQALVTGPLVTPAPKRRIVRNFIILPQRKAPAPKGGQQLYLPMDDLADYYYDTGTNGLLRPGPEVDFDRVNRYRRDVRHQNRPSVAQPSSDAWEFAHPLRVNEDEWSEPGGIADTANLVWHQSLDLGTASTVLSHLDPWDISEIGRCANNADDPERIKEAILTSLQDPDNPDHSLRDAYADWMTWIHPDYVSIEGGELSDILDQHVNRDDLVRTLSVGMEPNAGVLSFPRGVHGDQMLLSGRYDVMYQGHRSAIAEFGATVPPGLICLTDYEAEPSPG